MVVEMIRSTARFGEKYALAKYDALHAAAEDAAVFGRALKSNAVRIRLYIALTGNTRSALTQSWKQSILPLTAWKVSRSMAASFSSSHCVA